MERNMKYCQGPNCHTYETKDRLRGPKGNKTYQTRRRSSFYYGKGNFCDQRCMYDWINKHIEHGLDHFGRTTEPKVLTQDNAWKLYRDWGSPNNTHYLYNYLTQERRPINEQQFHEGTLINDDGTLRNESFTLNTR